MPVARKVWQQVDSGSPMAFPRTFTILNTSASYKGRADEVDFVRSLIRGDEHFFAAVLLLKCLQYLGYFPELSEIPATIVKHVRVCLRLPLAEMPAYDQIRTM